MKPWQIAFQIEDGKRRKRTAELYYPAAATFAQVAAFAQAVGVALWADEGEPGGLALLGGKLLGVTVSKPIPLPDGLKDEPDPGADKEAAMVCKSAKTTHAPQPVTLSIPTWSKYFAAPVRDKKPYIIPSPMTPTSSPGRLFRLLEQPAADGFEGVVVDNRDAQVGGFGANARMKWRP